MSNLNLPNEIITLQFMSEFKFGNLNYKILILLLSLRVCGPGSPGCVLKNLLMGKRACDAPGYNCFHGPAIAPSALLLPLPVA
jgi:hypothetical protein